MQTSLKTFSLDTELPAPWHTYLKGQGSLQFTGNTLQLVNTDTAAAHYTDAQIDDYQTLPRRNFLWQPPLQMTVRARFSHPAGTLSGTAGFGFWNDPFMMTGLRWPAFPRVIWFFYSSSPSNMKLDLHTPGPGWKAGTLDANRWPFFLLLPLAPLAVPLMNVDKLYQTFWPIGQRALHVNEALLTVDMTQWHTYRIRWQKKAAHFEVDGKVVLQSQTSPRGPLGFVLWLDNQYMVVTPKGHFKYGLLAAPGEQWLELDRLEIKNL